MRARRPDATMLRRFVWGLCVVAVGVFTLVTSAVAWLLLKYTMGIRVTLQEEIEGLDIGEHGNQAYPDFVTRKSHIYFGATASDVASAAKSENYKKEYSGVR